MICFFLISSILDSYLRLRIGKGVPLYETKTTGVELVESAEFEHACIFEEETGFDDINFFEEGVVLDGQFLVEVADENEGRQISRHAMVVDEGVFPGEVGPRCE